MTALLHALLVGGSHDEAFALACVLALAIVLRALARAVLRQNVIRVTKLGECDTATRDARIAGSDPARAAFVA